MRRGPILRQRVSDALDVGLSFDDVVASLVALAPTIGVERLTAVAPDLARALDYDIDADLERLDEVEVRPVRRLSTTPADAGPSSPR